jgi:hypothetical protein
MLEELKVEAGRSVLIATPSAVFSDGSGSSGGPSYDGGGVGRSDKESSRSDAGDGGRYSLLPND